MLGPELLTAILAVDRVFRVRFLSKSRASTNFKFDHWIILRPYKRRSLSKTSAQTKIIMALKKI
jgi:hypothetical protein